MTRGHNEHIQRGAVGASNVYFLLESAGQNQIKLLRSASGTVGKLSLFADADTTQILDFDSGLGLSAYSITGGPGQMTLDNIVTDGLDFSFMVGRSSGGNLIINHVDTGSGKANLSAGHNIYIGASGVTNSNQASAVALTAADIFGGAGALSLMATAGSIYDTSGLDLTSSTANIILTGQGAGINLISKGSIGSAGAGRLDISFGAAGQMLNVGASGDIRLNFLRSGSGRLSALSVTSAAAATQTIDFDSGLGLSAYAVTANTNTVSLDNVDLDDVEFFFSVTKGNLSVTALNTGTGGISLTAAGNVRLGASAISSSNMRGHSYLTGSGASNLHTDAIYILAGDSIVDDSSSDLTSATANISLTGNNGGVYLTAGNSIGASGAGRVDITIGASGVDLTLSSGGHDRIRLLRSGIGMVDTLLVTASANTAQTIDFDAGLGFNTYSVTGATGQLTLDSIDLADIDFKFALNNGIMNVTSIRTATGSVYLFNLSDAINLGASAIVTSSTRPSVYNISTSTNPTNMAHSGAIVVVTNAGGIFDVSGLDLTSLTANIQSLGAGGGVILSAFGGSVGGTAAGRIDIAVAGTGTDLIMNSVANNRVRLLNAGGTLDQLGVYALANTAQTIDFDAGLGLLTYSIAPFNAALTLTSIETTGIDFYFNAQSGDVNAVSVIATGKITVVSALKDIRISSSGIVTSSGDAQAVVINPVYGSIIDASGADLNAGSANIQVTGANAGVALRTTVGAIGDAGGGRLDISFAGANSKLSMAAGGHNQVRLLNAGAGSLGLLSVIAHPNTIQTIDFDSGLGISVYSVTGAAGAVTINDVAVADMDFNFTLTNGNLVITAFTVDAINKAHFLNYKGPIVLGGIGRIFPDVILEVENMRQAEMAVSGGSFPGLLGDTTIIGNLLIDGGTFTAPSGTLRINGGFYHLAGSFDANNGTVMLLDYRSAPLNVLSTTVFNNLIIDVDKTDLVTYLSFDDTTGTYILNSRHLNYAVNYGASLSGNVPGLSSLNVKSLSFNGIDNYVITTNVESLFKTPTITISIWFYPTGTGILVDETGDINATGMLGNFPWHDSVLEISPEGELRARIWTLQPVSLGQVNMNAWNHAVVRYDDKNLRMDGFLNGAQSAAIVGQRTMVQTYAGLYYVLGGGAETTSLGNGAFFKGNINDFRIYNRALSESEILTLASGSAVAPAASIPQTVVIQNDLRVTGDVELRSGTLDAGADYTITLDGDWLNTGGIFEPRGGAVILNGTGQAISGSNEFYNLEKVVTVEDTLTIDAGSTQTIGGAFTLRGVPQNLLSVRSSVPGTQWRVDPQGIASLMFVDVQDGYNQGLFAVDCAACINSGNNYGFKLPPQSPFEIDSFGADESPRFRMPAFMLDRGEESQRKSRNTANVIKIFKELFEQEKYNEALLFIEGPLNNADDYDLVRLNAAVSDQVVEILHKKNRLREAILRRKRSMPSFKSSSLANRIIELWRLQELYKNEVGMSRYLQDRPVSDLRLRLDPLQLQEQIRALPDWTGTRLDVAQHELHGNRYFAALYFDDARQEYEQALGLLDLLNATGKEAGIEDKAQLIRENLMMVYALNGDYAQALDLLEKLRAEIPDAAAYASVKTLLEKARGWFKTRATDLSGAA